MDVLCRNNGMSPASTDTMGVFKLIGGVPVSCRTPEQKVKDLPHILNWMRHQGTGDHLHVLNWMRHKGTGDHLHDPSGKFRKYFHRTEGRARELGRALDWLRSKVAPGVGDDPFSGSEVPLAGISKQSSETGNKEFAKALNMGQR
jgi:hypothetical protein